MEFKSHYPDFDVMREREHWDPHTREIVEKRIYRNPLKSLTEEEALILFKICTHLVADQRSTVISYIVEHFDQKLSSNIGEAQRKKGTPKESILIREGLRAVNHYSIATHGIQFGGLSESLQQGILEQIASKSIQLAVDGVIIPAKEFFNKLLTESVGAYYSHPDIWSEIGYAGPAYPRGYVRSEWGRIDPWEAKRNEKS